MQSFLKEPRSRIVLQNAKTSFRAFWCKIVLETHQNTHLFILNDREEAAFFYNDLELLFDETHTEKAKKRILFYPASYKKAYQVEKTDNANILYRSDVILKLALRKDLIIVTYPEALCEKVVTDKFIQKNIFSITEGEIISIDILLEFLHQFEYQIEDFVFEPGQFAWRGGIIDIFSYTDEVPYRLELDNDRVISIRQFNPSTQLSIKHVETIDILPNTKESFMDSQRISFTENLNKDTVIWIEDTLYCIDKLNQEFENIVKYWENMEETPIKHANPDELFISGQNFMKTLVDFSAVEFNQSYLSKTPQNINFGIIPQLSFNKSFDLLLNHLIENQKKSIQSFIASKNSQQIERIRTILQDLIQKHHIEQDIDDLFSVLPFDIHEGFTDSINHIAVYTEHQIFDKYQRFQLQEKYTKSEALSIKDLYNLTPGDYVTHIDYGIGRYSGLEKIEVNGKLQEAIRLVYKDNDILYISIHALHKISKYVGKNGSEPTLQRLGSGSWAKIKEQTKRKVKELAFDLIKLYAQRRKAEGFAYAKDDYLQTELEASFIYEETPDQAKAVKAVKKDMQDTAPMDRLICGDVGFGKTEIAIRAAFKAVCNNKQVAILVPTTVLAFQHYHTFTERLQKFPCHIEFLNRFKSAKEQKEILKDILSGNIDIIIGTHRLISKDIEFKNLGLLIIDEEQKFGVGAKEKIRSLKVNIDTLTLSATPIPRTLQLSLMGARDISILATPPANRYPIQTEVHTFNEELIRDAVSYELERGGQVFVVNNNIKNIHEVAALIARLVPDAHIAIGHGQMDGKTLEQIMVDFVNGVYDVLVATTIIESGIDIPNVNTIIIYDAQNFALNVLHQLRGRVGRMNKKAFCYLIAPPLSVLTEQAKKRLQAIEDFSELGSGFNIAMRDLDIRGAGDVLGAEQSGFISEIGFEMYQKILAEALEELNESDENTDRLKEPQDFVHETTIETDLGILIPDEYVSNVNERMNLYKEIDELHTEEEMDTFAERLIDRFGPIPIETQELIHAVRLRRKGRILGFERILLKNQTMICYFISKQDSKYYESNYFQKMLQYVTTHPKFCHLKEHNQKLSLTFDQILSVNDAILKLNNMQIEENLQQ